MSFFLFLLIVILILFLWPFFRQWAQRRMQRKMEQMLRRAMGMPPSDETPKGKSRRWWSNDPKKGADGKSKDSYDHRKIIPAEYAEDAEYVEIRSYRREEEVREKGKVVFRQEEQVEDAEWVEIRSKSDENGKKR